MTFPTIPTTGAGRLLTGFDTTPATATFPSLTGLTKNSGDLLIAIIAVYQSTASAGAVFSGWGGGFTEFVDQRGSATDMSIGAAYKWSTGSETGTFDVTVGATVTGHAGLILLSIPGAHLSTPPEGGTIAVGTSTVANPGALDPAGWGTEDTLWISVAASGEVTLTGSYTGMGLAAGPPTNYGSAVSTGESADAIGAVALAVAFRQNATSSEDVAAWTAVDTSNARNAALVIAVRPLPAPTVGAATGAVAWVGSATGARESRAAATGGVAWVGVATGTAVHSGASSGAVAWVGSATGSAPASGPNTGAATGAASWSGTASGVRVAGGTTTGDITWTGSATGAYPTYSEWSAQVCQTTSGAVVNDGAATGTVDWVGTATGARGSAGTSAGAVGWVGSATGARESRGAATGAVTWVGTVTGTRSSEGAATGAVTWVGSATGEAPLVDAQTGSASGTVTWAGTTTGARDSEGAATGTVTWTGAATGTAPTLDAKAGSATGTVAWSGAATGARTSAGAIAGTLTWTGSTTGLRTSYGTSIGTVTWTGSATGGHTSGPDANPIDITIREHGHTTTVEALGSSATVKPAAHTTAEPLGTSATARPTSTA
jgi:hypothetical protein